MPQHTRALVTGLQLDTSLHTPKTASQLRMLQSIATKTEAITTLKTQMNTDLLTEDLKKARSSNQSFWLKGEIDVLLSPTQDGLWQVEVNGFDYFDTAKGELLSGGKAIPA